MHFHPPWQKLNHREFPISSAWLCNQALQLDYDIKIFIELQPEELKTMAEYEAEATEQINKESMADELDKIEKALQQEIKREQQ